MRSEYLFRDSLEHVKAALMPQNRLIVEVMEHTGLRISDVLELKTEALRRRMTVREAKTGKSRRVSLSPALLVAIQQQAGPVWAFPGRKPGTHKTRQAVWKDIKRAAAAFRLRENVTPHSLRKVYAVRLFERYGDIERVRKALLHDNLEVTLLYALADKIAERRRS